MGWCSFLLIGHDSRREAARRAAVKAFLVTRTADLAFVLGLVILAVGRPDHRHPRRHRALDRRGAARRAVGGRGAEHGAAHGRAALPAVAASPASPPSCRSRTGCPTPWRARRRRRPSSTPRRWWPPGPTCSPGCSCSSPPSDTARLVLALGHRRHDGRGRRARLRPVRPQAAAGLLHHQPDRHHALGHRGRPRRGGPRTRASCTCSRTRCSRRCSSSPSGGSACSSAAPRR